jgi:hypothetical protein
LKSSAGRKSEPSLNWVTAERATVDRIACSWLIKNFVDKDAQFYFVPLGSIQETVKTRSAIPFDTPHVELTHYTENGKEYVTFDAIIKKYNLKDRALTELAKIVRGADAKLSGVTDYAPEARGLEAAAVGFRILASEDDHENMRLQFPLYEALYRYCQWIIEEGRELEHSVR